MQGETNVNVEVVGLNGKRKKELYEMIPRFELEVANLYKIS